MDGKELDIYRNYAWNYFLAHAQARLTTFRFYLFYCSIIMTGIFTDLTGNKHKLIGSTLCFLLTFISWIYWRVDIRHKQLIDRSQEALMEIESISCSALRSKQDIPGKLELFTREKFVTSTMPKFHVLKSFSKKNHFSYSKCVTGVFHLFMSLGVIGIIIYFIE